MRYPKVVYLGGAPMLGKTTVGRRLACRLGYNSISTDDIGIAIGAVTVTNVDPIDYREYYIAYSIDKFIHDVNIQHERLWLALRELIQKHEAWGHPVVIEGWAIRPSYVSSLPGDISGLFLLADELLIKKRVRSSNFSEGASNVELMIERYCERSFWFNAYLRDEVTRLDLKSLIISERMTTDEIVNECMNLLYRDVDT